MAKGRPTASADPMDIYIRQRLDAWGEDYSIDRELRLGISPKNLLALLMERGVRSDGTISADNELTWQIEQQVNTIAQQSPEMAAVLRAYYGGHGRRSVERYELATRIMGRRISKRTYYAYRDLGYRTIKQAILTA